MRCSCDIIGDIHGQYGKLQALLTALGYRKTRGAFRHPGGRTAVFLGDLIDRGPRQLEVLETVRAMVDAGSAQCLLGNHEYNAIGYFWGWRARSARNTRQHRTFLEQVGADSAVHRTWISWMQALPPILRFSGLNLCHAHWSEAAASVLCSGVERSGGLSADFLERSFKTEQRDAAGRVIQTASSEHDAVENVLKGPEVALPTGVRLADEGGIERTRARLRWWHEGRHTWRNATVVLPGQEAQLPDTPLPQGIAMGTDSALPVMVGHYWLVGTPRVASERVAVLDWGASGRGPLVAYRWDGEAALSSDKLVAVGSTRNSSPA